MNAPHPVTDVQFDSPGDAALDHAEIVDELARVLARFDATLAQILDELDAIRKQRRLPVKLVHAEPSPVMLAIQQRMNDIDDTFKKFRVAWRDMEARVAALEGKGVK
jgi:hypothetical protein